jgi:hypothetical protein
MLARGRCYRYHQVYVGQTSEIFGCHSRFKTIIMTSSSSTSSLTAASKQLPRWHYEVCVYCRSRVVAVVYSCLVVVVLSCSSHGSVFAFYRSCIFPTSRVIHPLPKNSPRIESSLPWKDPTGWIWDDIVVNKCPTLIRFKH